MAQTSKATIDPQTIRRWAEKHGGHPAKVKGTGKGNQPPILRIDFPGYSGEGKLEEIAWNDFSRWFESQELALLYRDRDRFNKIVSRETVSDLLEEGPRRRRATAAGGRSARSRTQARATTGRAATTKATRTPRKRATSHTKRTPKAKSTSTARARAGEKRPRAR
jgi:hypothetical protein